MEGPAADPDKNRNREPREDTFLTQWTYYGKLDILNFLLGWFWVYKCINTEYYKKTEINFCFVLTLVIEYSIIYIIN